MEFNQLFPVLKKHLSDGYDVPEFFRELMAMITTVSESEWGTPKDPSTNLTKDETIRTYAKRPGLTKKLAQSIAYRLTPENLVKSINKHPRSARQLLADDLHGYDPELSADDVASKVAEWMVQIVQASAGLISQDEQTQRRQQHLAADLKMKFGDYLLNEADDYCPFPGCGKSLTVTNNGKAVPSYEISLIDKAKSPTIENLIALCPKCYATYLVDDSKSITKELQGIKTILLTRKYGARLLDDLPMEKGIVGVIRKVKNLKEKDLLDASLDPKDIKQKLNPADNYALYMTVNHYVTTYFIRITEIFVNLDKRGEIDYDEIQNQMRAIYKKLKKNKKTNVEIFNQIAEKIHRVSLQDDIYCQIIVSFFIQKCEVFDAITE